MCSTRLRLVRQKETGAKWSKASRWGRLLAQHMGQFSQQTEQQAKCAHLAGTIFSQLKFERTCRTEAATAAANIAASLRR